MDTDLVFDPFGADMGDMIDAARLVDTIGGFGRIWVFDHFSGSMVGAPWSRDPFVALGAIASSTRHVGLGVLVANIANRHPAQLASAINTVQAVAPNRVVCGLGAGSGPGTRFATEQTAIGKRLADGPTRRVALAEYTQALRQLWAGQDSHGEHFAHHGLHGVVDDQPLPPIIIGATGRATITIAARHADGVNIRDTDHLADGVATATQRAERDDFEISVMTDLDHTHPAGGTSDRYETLNLQRRMLVTKPPYPKTALRAIATNLANTMR